MPKREDQILLTFPIWTIVIGATTVQLNYKGGVAAIGLFTDKDLADRFVSHMGDASARSIALQSDTYMIQVLKTLKSEHGYTHVVIDPINVSITNQPSISIDDFIASLSPA